MTEEISANVLIELLSYCDKSGSLFWKRRARKWFKSDNACNAWNAKHEGKEAFTCKIQNGYKTGRIFNKPYRAHRVAFAIMTGCWPEENIDHINGDPSNNSWKNLRCVSQKENCRNSRLPKDNKSGVIGVHYWKSRNRWKAEIGVNGKRIGLGVFDTLDQAAQARLAAEKKYGFHQNHGRTA